MILFLLACGANVNTDKPITSDTDTGDTGTPLVDADGDGADSSLDCDDDDPSAYPDAEEICDGIDNNCDGTVDEGVTETVYTDGDGDGYGDLSGTVTACTQPDGYSPSSDDCDDGDWNTYPGAPEICDGFDNDCNGLDDADEGVCE